jgi:RNA polymerase sigma-70 factor (ECF subfamily)
MEENMHPSRAAGVYELTARRQALRFVEAFADSLSEKNRSIFILSELEQLPVPEIAQMIDMNVNTVYSRRNEIRKDLELRMNARFKDKDGRWYE